jgi:hypothetical protein
MQPYVQQAPNWRSYHTYSFKKSRVVLSQKFKLCLQGSRVHAGVHGILTVLSPAAPAAIAITGAGFTV